MVILAAFLFVVPLYSTVGASTTFPAGFEEFDLSSLPCERTVYFAFPDLSVMLFPTATGETLVEVPAF